MSETFNKIENREEPPKNREIELYLLRHAEALDQTLDAELTEHGKEQAREAAHDLMKKVLEKGGGIIKFIVSPVRRAQQTAEVMQQVIQEIISEQKGEDVRLMTSRDREALKAGGVIGPLSERGIDDPIDYWLQNPDVLENKSPAEIAKRLSEVVVFLQKMADRLPNGEKVYYIGITHEVPQAALLNQISGKTLNELGGKIQNCESIRIELKGNSDEDPTILFRDQTMRISKSDNSSNEHE